MNFTIKPYKTKEGFWTFLDTNTSRTEDENMLVGGMDTMLDQLQEVYDTFFLEFSDSKFDKNCLTSFELYWASGDKDNTTKSIGNYYLNSLTGVEGWLCPVLFDYFEKAPLVLYIKVTN